MKQEPKIKDVPELETQDEGIVKQEVETQIEFEKKEGPSKIEVDLGGANIK